MSGSIRSADVLDAAAAAWSAHRIAAGTAGTLPIRRSSWMGTQLRSATGEASAAGRWVRPGHYAWMQMRSVAFRGRERGCEAAASARDREVMVAAERGWDRARPGCLSLLAKEKMRITRETCDAGLALARGFR